MYRAELPRFGSVAVKRFTAWGERDNSGQDFTRELDALCQCRHPHILEIIGHAHEGPENLIIMPLMEGGALSYALPRMLWAMRAVVLGQVVRSLSFLHGKGMLHRDVKTSNILLDQSLRHSRLADFGLAKEQVQAQFKGKGTTGVVVGSPGYMAPELMMRPASEKTDSFALGVVLLEILTGLPAWGGANGEGVSLVDSVVIDGVFQDSLEDSAAQWPREEGCAVAEQAVALTLFDPSRRTTAVAVEQDARYLAHVGRAELQLAAGDAGWPAVSVVGKRR